MTIYGSLLGQGFGITVLASQRQKLITGGTVPGRTGPSLSIHVLLQVGSEVELTSRYFVNAHDMFLCGLDNTAS